MALRQVKPEWGGCDAARPPCLDSAFEWETCTSDNNSCIALSKFVAMDILAVCPVARHEGSACASYKSGDHSGTVTHPYWKLRPEKTPAFAALQTDP
jgi:hypothetical protein